jgi:hypothetical protein
MKQVENHPFQTNTMKQFRLEQELAELRAIDPALADKHLQETVNQSMGQLFSALVGLGIWLYVMYVVFTVL